MKNSTKQQVYANPKQLAFLNAKQRRKGFVGGRGSGKSTSYGFKNYLRYNYLPRTKFFTAGLTYTQILNKTLPAAKEAWTKLKLIEYNRHNKFGHYVVGVRPPDDWIKPHQPPGNYQNIISFINGYTIDMLSMDRPELARGGNYDGGDVDESALMKKEIITRILLPSIRANPYKYDHYLHWSFCHYTSAPWLPSGQWVYDYEELQKEEPDEYFFLESTAEDNKEALPPTYIKDLRRELSTLEFDVEVMNKRVKKLPNCFYPSFDESRHCRWITYYYQHDEETGITVATSNDTDDKKPIDGSWDFNAVFTSCIIGQEHGMEARIVNTLYVKQSTTNLVDELCDKILEAYANHSCKVFNVYGDRNGNSRSAGNNKTFYQQIEDKFHAKGWQVNFFVITEYPGHQLKHRVINGIMAEDNPRLPVLRINQNTCKFLIISIQNSPINPDWTKDKRGENLLLEQERATHLSDCLDYYLFRKYSHLFGVATYQSYQVKFM